MSVLNQQPTSRQFWGTALLFCACLLTLLFLYGYGYGGWNPLEDQDVSRWAVAGTSSPRKEVMGDKLVQVRHNTSWSGEKTQATPAVGFNMTRELRRLNPGIFSALPKEFLPDYKNPCWFEKVQGTDVDSRWRKRLSDNGTGHFRLRCLPYFYVMGVNKCGTTDLYNRITQHPDVVPASKKEPKWWTWDQHVNLGPVWKKTEIFGFQKRNSQKKKYENIGQMLPETRRILDEFYRPYNERLSELLNNTDFLWQENSSV